MVSPSPPPSETAVTLPALCTGGASASSSRPQRSRCCRIRTPRARTSRASATSPWCPPPSCRPARARPPPEPPPRSAFRHQPSLSSPSYSPISVTSDLLSRSK
jgi:hypothetical protein